MFSVRAAEAGSESGQKPQGTTQCGRQQVRLTRALSPSLALSLSSTLSLSPSFSLFYLFSNNLSQVLFLPTHAINKPQLIRVIRVIGPTHAINNPQ